MKNKIIHTLPMLLLLAMVVFSAHGMEEHAPHISAGKEEEVEEAPVKGPGKRLAEEQPKGEPETKQGRTASSSVHTKFITKDIIKPKRVLNVITGNYDIRDEIVDTIIINDEYQPEPFTGTTFEELIKERTDERLYYIIAAVKTEVNFVQKIDYYDAYKYMTYVFGSDFILGEKTGPTDNPTYISRYMQAHQLSAHAKYLHPHSKAPVLGTIDFYFIAHSNDAAFTYLGSDYDLHVKHDTERAKFMRRFFKANTPNEMIGQDTEALTQRAGNQYLVGEHYYNTDNFDDALHYFILARDFPAHAQSEPIDIENVVGINEVEYVNFTVDCGWYIAQIYARQGKYDAAIAELKEIEGHEWMSYNDILVDQLLGQIYYAQHDYEKALPYLEAAQYRVESYQKVQGRKISNKVLDPDYQQAVARPLASTYYHLQNYDKAWEYLLKIPDPSSEEKALLKTLSERRLQEEWQRMEHEE